MYTKTSIIAFALFFSNYVECQKLKPGVRESSLIDSINNNGIVCALKAHHFYAIDSLKEEGATFRTLATCKKGMLNSKVELGPFDKRVLRLLIYFNFQFDYSRDNEIYNKICSELSPLSTKYNLNNRKILYSKQKNAYLSIYTFIDPTVNMNLAATEIAKLSIVSEVVLRRPN